ncbi:hypothetical protein [Actinoplanes sp. NBRC 101535]|uniref:hypothetical protein n=1 Tax=Actinoplanes sp. NBRC 101535 TaxID=3032196 RepID=UPI0024A48A49|nr:hypothetical protein [Actinoplanes sp. NBRC 101535]GLY08601.1 hypothetical protein Acsp01_89800 [Actinoplanes sp. NBRC 101535]
MQPIPDEVRAAWRRLAGDDSEPRLPAVAATVAATATAATADADADEESDPTDTLDALVLLRWARTELAAIEPVLIAAARAADVSWQELAPALGVASRQAAERRYLRLIPATADQQGSTRDGRVQAERDRRAGTRAVTRWANANTAGLRQLAGQVAALDDLDPAATDDVGRLRDALGDHDATRLPGLLAGTHRHLGHHPGLADQVDAVMTTTDRVRQQSERDRGAGPT